MASRAFRHDDLILLVDVAAEIAAAVRTLSRHRYGAVLLWDPAIAIAGGVLLDAVVSRQLLVAIFLPESLNGLCDGVTLIRADRVERAGVPVTWADVAERAAELFGGVAIAVDEDTGKIRWVDRTGHVEIVNGDALARVLYRYALGGRVC